MHTLNLLRFLFNFLFSSWSKDARLTARLLRYAHLKFYLTGSRFFGTHRRSSDYDLFVERSHQAFQYLISLGFQPRLPDLMEELMEKYVGDPQICDVYERGKVQVQIVHDAELKMLAQEYLKSMPKDALFYQDLHNRDKSRMRGWWKSAYYEANMVRRDIHLRLLTAEIEKL